MFWVTLSIREGIDSPRPASQRAAAFILTAAMLTTLAAPAFATTWYIENGDITVKAGKIEGTNKVSQGETTDEEDTNTIITNRDKDTASSHTVTIEANDKNDKVEVTLKDVNIEANSGHALTSNGDVTLTLKGENHLTGGNGGRYGGSGISSNGSLTITGGENDSLTAQGGSSADGERSRREDRQRHRQQRRPHHLRRYGQRHWRQRQLRRQRHRQQQRRPHHLRRYGQRRWRQRQLRRQRQRHLQPAAASPSPAVRSHCQRRRRQQCERQRHHQ